MLFETAFGADIQITHQLSIPNSNDYGILDPILDSDLVLKGFVLADTANKSLAIGWLDSDSLVRIALSNRPTSVANYFSGDTLVIFCLQHEYTGQYLLTRFLSVAGTLSTDTAIVPQLYYVGLLASEEASKLRLERNEAGAISGVALEAMFVDESDFHIWITYQNMSTSVVYSPDLRATLFRRQLTQCVAGDFTERPLLGTIPRPQFGFKDDLGASRHHQVDRSGANDFDRSTLEAASNG